MLKIDNIGPEWGRHGSPRAHTQSQRSHGLQEGFWIPPGPPGHHIMSKNNQKVKNPKNSKFSDFSDFLIFLLFYGVPEVREVSRKLPGARGFVVIEYEPVASHGDPIPAQNDRECDKSRCTGEP